MLKDVLLSDTASLARAEIERRLGRGSKANSHDVARALSLSLRTMQRQLAVEGTSFSILIDTVRRESALARLAAGKSSLGEISASLGYTRQSTLTRAVLRWTGKTPSGAFHGKSA